MATEDGTIKKTALEPYSRPKSGGIIGIALDEDDDLISVVLTHAGDEVVLSTRMGMAIRFAETDARAMGRNTRGVKGINLQEGDAVVGMVVADPDGFLLTVCENGYGKRTPFGANAAAEEPEVEEETAEEPPAADRGRGRRNRTIERRCAIAGSAAAARGCATFARATAMARSSASFPSARAMTSMLITTQGMVNRTHAAEIRITGRNAQGVRVMNLNEGDKVASFAKIAPDDATEPESEIPPPRLKYPFRRAPAPFMIKAG